MVLKLKNYLERISLTICKIFEYLTNKEYRMPLSNSCIIGFLIDKDIAGLVT